MIASESVIFAIKAGIKLGSKINQVLIDETVERPLILPLGNLFGDVDLVRARNYFRYEHPELVAAGGAYAGLNNDEKIKAYRTILALRQEVGDENGLSGSAETIVQGLKGFEQLKAGFGARPALQRILGTVVEIGIDYYIANPQQLEGTSDSRKILASFIEQLDDIDFAESTPKALVSDILLASLRTLNENVTLLDDDERLASLIGGISQSLINDYESLQTVASRERRGLLIKRIASSVVKGGAAAFSENIGLFVRDDPDAKKLVSATLSQVVKGIESKADIFSNDSIELIYKSALSAVGEHSELFTSDAFLQDVISNTVKALTQGPAREVFSETTVAAIVQGGLEALRDNMETLVDPTNPQKELLSNTIKSIAHGLSQSLAGGGTVKDLLSKRQLVEMTKIAFYEVARNPEHLLAGVDDADKRSALAQVLGSLARALGDEPRRLITGEGFLKLVNISLKTAVLNADKLLKLDTADIRTNVIFKITQQIATALLEHPDPRGLVNRGLFILIAERSFPIVSANLDGLLNTTEAPIKAVVEKGLDLASDTLQNRVNGANLPDLIEVFLLRVLRGELNLSETTATLNAANEALSAA